MTNDERVVFEYRDIGNFSAVDPAYSRDMRCDTCRVRWVGCWDNFQCPECGDGELPSADLRDLVAVKALDHDQ